MNVHLFFFPIPFSCKITNFKFRKWFLQSYERILSTIFRCTGEFIFTFWSCCRPIYWFMVPVHANVALHTWSTEFASDDHQYLLPEKEWHEDRENLYISSPRQTETTDNRPFILMPENPLNFKQDTILTSWCLKWMFIRTWLAML